MYRQENSPHKVYAVDLLHPDIYLNKLQQVKEWYKSLGWDAMMPSVHSLNLDEHYKMFDHVQLITTDGILREGSDIIFEGAQGVLLDRDHGFFPNVTYGHTTVRNAVELLSRVGYPPAGIQYVTRAYHTRHGAGPMGNGKPLNLPDTTNRDGEWQGPFRTAEMDFDLLFHAYMVNYTYTGPYDKFEVNVTCADRVDEFMIEPFKEVFQEHMIRAWFGAEREAKAIEYL
jgi:adenylosuccinate synthase